MSAAWSHFEQNFLNANSWAQRKDGFPADLLDALSPEERERAIVILKKGWMDEMTGLFGRWLTCMLAKVCLF